MGPIRLVPVAGGPPAVEDVAAGSDGGAGACLSRAVAPDGTARTTACLLSPYNYPLWFELISHFFLHIFTLFFTHTRNVFIQLKRNGGLTHHGVLGRHERNHEHVASGRGRGCRHFFVNTRAKVSSMIYQS
jgi:hypothetical protein